MCCVLCVLYSLLCVVLRVVWCSVESVPCLPGRGLRFCMAAPIPPPASVSTSPWYRPWTWTTPSHLQLLYYTGFAAVFLLQISLHNKTHREIFYLGRQSINLTQITFTEKFSCALAPSSISMVRFILCCGNTNININSIEVVPAAVASPAPACRQLWGSAAALQTTLPLGATLTAILKTGTTNIVLYGQIQNKWKRWKYRLWIDNKDKNGYERKSVSPPFCL